MSSQTIPGLPAAIALNGDEQLWAVQDGIDVRITPDQIAALVTNAGVAVISGNASLGVGINYALRSSLGAFGGTLPALSSVLAGQFLEITDIDNDVGVNNFTITAHSGDLIASYDTTASTFVINLSNTITRVIAGPASWRAIQYAG